MLAKSWKAKNDGFNDENDLKKINMNVQLRTPKHLDQSEEVK